MALTTADHETEIDFKRAAVAVTVGEGVARAAFGPLIVEAEPVLKPVRVVVTVNVAVAPGVIPVTVTRAVAVSKVAEPLPAEKELNDGVNVNDEFEA